MPRLLRLLLLPLLLVGVLHAQSVRWDPPSGDLPRDQVSRIALVFDGATPKDLPKLPAVDGLEFGDPSQSNQSFNIVINGRSINQGGFSLSYPVRPTRPDGEVRIPAFTVETDRGVLTVPAAGFRVITATVGQSGLRLDQIARARLAVSAPSVWAGEVFKLDHVLEVGRNTPFRSGDALTWNNSLLVTDAWGAPERAAAPTAGTTAETRSTRALASKPGKIEIGTVSQEVLIATGRDLFGQTVGTPYTLATDPFPLEVRPLPSPAPADFIGAVGQFKLSSKVVPEKAAVGEPITWTLTLEGTGNWPAIDKLRPRILGRDFRVVSPRAQKTPKADTLFEATFSEDLVLIPQKGGRTTLGPYTLSIFNPSSGSYETLRVEPVTIEITAPSTPPPPAAATTPEATPAESAALPSPAPAAPAPVAKLPADPLPSGLLSIAPCEAWPRALLRAPFALLAALVLWLLLAARHARAHDPLRARREAHERLRQILARLEAGSLERGAGSQDKDTRGASDSDSLLLAPGSTLLLAWQHATRTLFDLPSLTPSARDLPDPVWSALWIETERALYRPDTALPKDWFAQAWQAHAQATPPARGLFAAFRPAHLFPRVALWIVAFSTFLLAYSSASAAPAEAADALQLYARGDFPAAEKAIRETLSTAPLDSALRHNLALALAQQGKWDEAAAHAYAAALQTPRDPAIERLFAATAPKASYRLRLAPSAAQTLSVHGWQNLALGSALLLLSVAPSAYVLALYRPGRRRALLATGHACLILAGAALITALVALRAHGPTTDPDAVLVWRTATLRAVPTDVGDQKVTAELPAGTLARVDKEFLGWRRVVLPDGNTGWVRAEPLVPLWR